jgi:hypothetical protein
MEMHFAELEEKEQEQEQEGYKNNYWTNEGHSKNTKSKKKVSYDDILSSLNMVVHDGVLQFARPAVKQQQQQQPSQPSHSLQQQQYRQPQHSYIHNKYFQAQEEPAAPRRPMTREEYIRDYNARLASQRRIAQIKKDHYLKSNRNSQQKSWKDQILDAEGEGCVSCFV